MDSQISARANALNQQLEDANPALAQALSPIGRAAFYPKDIPFQAAEARKADFNATIGQITDGAGSILSVSAISKAVNLSERVKNRALLYSPIAGQPELRDAWNRYQTPTELRRGEALPCGPPVVTVGLTHAISLVADLFGGPGRDVVIPDPCWGNYNQVFGVRGGSTMRKAPTYVDGRWSWSGLRATLASLDADSSGKPKPVVVILNLPSNPGGYSPTAEERAELIEIFVESAERRPTVVLCDDAYSGLVFDPQISSRSMFWDLLGKHPGLIPLRGAGSTKEFLLFGGRVGFLTLPCAAGSTEFEVLEDKLSSLIRSSVGSPVSLSQMTLLEALRSQDTSAEIEAVRKRLAGRFETMRAALETADGNGTSFRVMPCNSGAFMLLEILAKEGRPALDPEAVRRSLLEDASTGVIAIAPNYLRLAFCSVARTAIPQLVERVTAALDQ